jgi:hypothetical protein
MANTLVECVKNLFGSEQELTNYELCLDNSCLCYMSAEPICTDREIVDKFCPQEWFAQDSGVASTTTTTPSPALPMSPPRQTLSSIIANIDVRN